MRPRIFLLLQRIDKTEERRIPFYLSANDAIIGFNGTCCPCVAAGKSRKRIFGLVAAENNTAKLDCTSANLETSMDVASSATSMAPVFFVAVSSGHMPAICKTRMAEAASSASMGCARGMVAISAMGSSILALLSSFAAAMTGSNLAEESLSALVVVAHRRHLIHLRLESHPKTKK